MTLLIHNATLIDGTGVDPRPGVSVLDEDGRIASIAPADGHESGDTGGSQPLVGGFRGCPLTSTRLHTGRAGGKDDIHNGTSGVGRHRAGP